MGGIELNVRRLARWLNARGHHCVIVAAQDSPLHHGAAADGTDCLAIPARSRYTVFGDARLLARRFHDTGIDTLILNANRDLLLGVLAKRRSRNALRLLQIQHMQIGRPKRDAIHRWQHRQLDAWLAPLPTLAAQTQRLTAVPPDRIHLVPLGIELAPLLAAPTRSAARAALHLPSEAFIAGVIGRLDRGKGQEYLLRAVARLRADGHDIHVLLVGEETRGERQGYARELALLAESLRLTNHVHFRGFVADVPTAYAALDVFTLTSLSETYGMVTIEAMAAGCPVIATDSGGTPDLLTLGQEAPAMGPRTGSNGTVGQALLVPPGDADALERALLRFMTERGLAETLRENGRRHALRHFSHDTQCAAIEELLDSLPRAH